MCAPGGLGPYLFVRLHYSAPGTQQYTSGRGTGLSYEKEELCSLHLGAGLALTDRPGILLLDIENFLNITVVQSHSGAMMSRGINKTAP